MTGQPLSPEWEQYPQPGSSTRDVEGARWYERLADLAFDDSFADLLEGFVDELPGASVLAFDTDLRYVFARGEAIGRGGMSPADLEGRLAADALPPERWVVYRPLYERALHGESASVTIAAPDGARVYLVRVAPAHDRAGAVVGGVALATDVTEVDRGRTFAEEQFRLLAQSSEDVFVRSDRTGIITWISDSVTHLLGFEPEELLGTVASELAHTDDWQQAREQRLYSGDPLNAPSGGFVMRARTKEGGYRWVSLTAAPVLEDGRPAGGFAALRDVDELVRTRQAARALRDKYQLLAENASDIVFRVGREGLIEWVSPGLETISGYEDDEMIGRSFTDFIHPDDLHMVDHLAQEVLSGGMARMETRLRSSDGEYHWLAIQGRPVVEDGVVVGAVGGCRDVDQEHRAAAALADSEARYRLLAEYSSDVILRIGPRGRVLWVSPSVSQAFGWMPAELVGRSSLKLFHPEDLPGLLETVDRMRRNGGSGRIVARISRADGTYLWCESATMNATDTDGSQVRIVRVRDIDEQIRASQALARSERTLRLAMDSASVGMAITDLDRHFTRVNPALCRMLGRSEVWLLSHALDALLDPEMDAADRHTNSEIVSGRRDSATVDRPLVRADGTTLWVRHSTGLLRDENGEPLSFVSQFVDISEDRLAHEWVKRQAVTDPLTGLVNRRGLELRLEELDKHSPRPPLAVLYCDLDQLKPINDTFGHMIGDAVIRTAAQRILGRVREDDIVARIGGDEFLVILPGLADTQSAGRRAHRILGAFREPMVIGDVKRPVTLSVGVAVTAPDESYQTAIQRADEALYDAKSQGRDRLAHHDAHKPASGRASQRSADADQPG